MIVLPPLLVDNCIGRAVVHFLRSKGIDVVSVCEEEWERLKDSEILEKANALGRLILTQDSDFGKLTVHDEKPAHRIIFLRPGSRPSSYVIDDLQNLLDAQIDWSEPLLVIYRAGNCRVRRLVMEPGSALSERALGARASSCSSLGFAGSW